MNGEFEMGSHHFSLAVYADNLADLDDNIGLARARLAEAGAIAVPETLGMEAAYWAQLPGNLDWRTRPAVVSSLNFSHLADFPAFPTGSQSGRWGEAAVRFKTTAGTAYDYVPHIDDVGMTAIFGRIGSGKSTLLDVSAGDVRPVHRRARRHHRVLRQGPRRRDRDRGDRRHLSRSAVR